ncbi:MAG: sulfotransferase [Candidatus Thermoplasmatota archaeon]
MNNLKKSEVKNLDKKYLDRIKDVSFKPVFILGFHRSGTSILYKMIQSTGKFNSVTTYHVLKYNRLIHNHVKGLEQQIKEELNRYFADKDRGIDRLDMNADLPLEYAFLINGGYLFSSLTEKNFDVFLEMCKKIQYVDGRDKKLLLKNPWDFSNFLFIKKHLPEAKFVFIHRHPLPVMNSSMKALRVLAEEETVYSDIISPIAKKLRRNPILSVFADCLLFRYFPLALILIVEHHAKDSRRFVKNIRHLDKSDYVNIKYEELCEKPAETMGRIVNLLDLEEDNLERFNEFIEPRDLSISKDVKMMEGYIMKRMKSYCRFLGYSKEKVD